MENLFVTSTTMSMLTENALTSRVSVAIAPPYVALCGPFTSTSALP